MNLLLTGGSGLLGSELIKTYYAFPDICYKHNINSLLKAPSSEELDICTFDSCKSAIEKYKPNIIIHAAAFTSPPRCNQNPQKARNTNIMGTVNLLNACENYNKNIKFVYISTDYVFDGKKGSYSPDDLINPVNKYAITKAAGELAVKTYDNHLIIRTSFCEKQFPYEKAFVDQYTSRDYIDIIAPLILEHSISNKTGIIHVGTERKTVYELAAKRKPDVGKLSIADVQFNVPIDTSFK